MAQAALSEILAAARFDAPAMAGIRGEDPVLPVRYRIGTAGAASLAALGLAVEALWELRGGARQRVEVDLRAAAVSLRSARYLHVNGKPPPSPWDPLSGFYPVREGWISIHCNFRNHREAAMGVLGAATREAGEQASRGWQGEALEDAIHAAGGFLPLGLSEQAFACPRTVSRRLLPICATDGLLVRTDGAVVTLCQRGTRTLLDTRAISRDGHFVTVDLEPIDVHLVERDLETLATVRNSC